jgi:hypothetical protein
MKTKQSTLTSVELRPGRRNGNTTRQIDRAIDIIFSPGEICKVLDHAESGMNKNANEDLFNRICKRLELEHKVKIIERKYLEKNTFYVGYVSIDKNKLEIELL